MSFLERLWIKRIIPEDAAYSIDYELNLAIDYENPEIV